MQFRINGLPYTLIKRNDKVALYRIGGTYTNEILHWEVSKIYIRKDKYGIRESQLMKSSVKTSVDVIWIKN